MDSAFNRFEFCYIIQFGISCKNLSMSRLQTPKDLQNVITDTWHDIDIRQPESEKQYCSGKSV